MSITQEERNYEIEKARINLEIAKLAIAQAAKRSEHDTEDVNKAFNGLFTNISKKVWGES